MADTNDHPTEKLYGGIESYESGSAKLVTWSLSIVGGSILIIISDSYFRPSNIYHRYFYFLFLLGWIFLAISMYHAFLITRRGMVKALYKDNPKLLTPIFEETNTSFKWQLRCFQWGLLCFGIWLVSYLTWWIFSPFPNLKP